MLSLATEFHVDSKVLTKALKFVGSFVAKDASRPDMEQVAVVPHSSDGCWLVATDAYKMAWCWVGEDMLPSPLPVLAYEQPALVEPKRLISNLQGAVRSTHIMLGPDLLVELDDQTFRYPKVERFPQFVHAVSSILERIYRDGFTESDVTLVGTYNPSHLAKAITAFTYLDKEAAVELRRASTTSALLLTAPLASGFYAGAVLMAVRPPAPNVAFPCFTTA